MSDQYPHQNVTEKIIAAAIEMHRHVGPGLLESTYQAFLAEELRQRDVSFLCEVSVPVEYKGVRVDCGYRVDFLMENKVIVELKSVEKVLEIHKAQLLTYLKMTGKTVGLIINFNVPLLKDGIIRRVL